MAERRGRKERVSFVYGDRIQRSDGIGFSGPKKMRKQTPLPRTGKKPQTRFHPSRSTHGLSKEKRGCFSNQIKVGSQCSPSIGRWASTPLHDREKKAQGTREGERVRRVKGKEKEGERKGKGKENVSSSEGEMGKEAGAGATGLYKIAPEYCKSSVLYIRTTCAQKKRKKKEKKKVDEEEATRAVGKKRNRIEKGSQEWISIGAPN